MSDTDILFGEPHAWYSRDLYAYDYSTPDGKPMARIELDYIKEDGDRILTEISVWWTLGQEGDGIQLAGPDRVNLLNSTKGQSGWGAVVSTCNDAVRNVTIDWGGGIGTVVRDAVRHFRSADEAFLIELKENSESNKPFLLQPWVSSTGTTLIYAPGGTGKSMIVLGLALSVATGMNIFGSTPSVVGPVLYLDYEDDMSIHQERLSAICRAVGYKGQPDILHMGLTKSVRSSVRQIKKVAAKIGAVLIILDSVGLARGADPNSGGETIDLFKYLRDIGIPVLAVDHVRKEHIEKIRSGRVDPNTVLAFGSQYSMSSARLAWFLHELGTSTAEAKVFNAHNTKHNHVPQQKPFCLTMNLDATDHGALDTVTFVVDGNIHIDLSAAEKSRKMEVAEAIAVAGRPLTGTEIAKVTGIPGSTVRSELQRDLTLGDKSWFEKQLVDGKTVPYDLSMWGSVSHAYAQEAKDE